MLRGFFGRQDMLLREVLEGLLHTGGDVREGFQAGVSNVLHH